MPPIRKVTVAALTALILLSSACGGTNEQADAARAKKIVAITPEEVPAELLGLKLAPEEVLSTVQANKGSYVEAVGMYSLRRGDLLQATLQVSRFTDKSGAEKSRFRRSVVLQIGSTNPEQYRMGKQTIYMTSGKQQRIAVWFKERTMFILSTRTDYDTPRTLIREAIKEVKP